MSTYDLAALVEQKREAVGSEDIVFEWKGETFTMPHPLFLDDDVKDELVLCETDVDIAILYLGDEQYDRFRELGGKSSFIGLLIGKAARDAQEQDAEGNGSASSRSSARGRNRLKRR